MILCASSLQKSYNNRLVLEASLDFTEGNLYSILGPNGSGKSTLLRLLAGLEEPEQGGVTFDNSCSQPILVPDRKGLFNDSVLKNVSYGLKIRKVSGADLQQRVEKVLKAVDLWHLRKANALTLSDGEAQRLCLAMAMVIEPAIILLDEPTSSLDPRNTMQVERLIGKMKESARLIIMVTHNIFQARRLSDYAVFLYQGRLVETTPAGTFFEAPVSEDARNFLKGEMVY